MNQIDVNANEATFEKKRKKREKGFPIYVF